MPACGPRGDACHPSAPSSEGWLSLLLPVWPAARACRVAGQLQPEQLPEDLLHDLVGTATDRPEAGVAGGSLHVVLAHVARAAVDLDGVVGNVEGVALGL